METIAMGLPRKTSHARWTHALTVAGHIGLNEVAAVSRVGVDVVSSGETALTCRHHIPVGPVLDHVWTLACAMRIRAI
ncbi:hypothetical protein DPMN_124815 [Dreissena polymorpha]|uniref:Uncharacterized protein n=1 Tax=Dreissena polymorpha TaxID=45954 RepID=A0A9D4GWQ6_DREPO|nr:hypothetical protein DPMN_124815 [Dreissena polymorpha]